MRKVFANHLISSVWRCFAVSCICRKTMDSIGKVEMANCNEETKKKKMSPEQRKKSRRRKKIFFYGLVVLVVVFITSLAFSCRTHSICKIGLAHLHTKCRIIHTDIKPENVLVCMTPSQIKNDAIDAIKAANSGARLPGSAICTAPKEVHELVNQSMSKNKNKKMRRKMKKNQQLLVTQLSELEGLHLMQELESASLPSTARCNGEMQNEILNGEAENDLSMGDHRRDQLYSEEEQLIYHQGMSKMSLQSLTDLHLEAANGVHPDNGNHQDNGILQDDDDDHIHQEVFDSIFDPPVNGSCDNIQVKIADLGNAC